MNKELLRWKIHRVIGKVNQHVPKKRATTAEAPVQEPVWVSEQESEEEAGVQENKAKADSPYAFSGKELEKAIVMSVILGPPACRKRKRYESNTGRR